MAKGAILTLAPTGLGFILSGWIVGVICLFLAGGLSLILWTPLGRWLGLHDNDPDQAGDFPSLMPVIQERPQGNRVHGDAAGGAARRSQPDPAGQAMEEIRAMFERSERKKRDIVEAELVLMIDEGRILMGDPFDGDRPTREELAAWQEPLTKFVGDILGPIELQRLSEVGSSFPNTWGQIDAIVGWLRERRDNPSSWETRVRGLDGPGLDAAIEARRGGQSKMLADQLDALMREGMELLDELMVPAQAEETSEGTWMLEFGEAPAEWSEKADAFYKKIKDLLVAENPALLPDLERGFNERLGIQRESIREAPALDGRSNAQKMLDFATETQRTPARIVEACLEGLSHARKAI